MRRKNIEIKTSIDQEDNVIPLTDAERQALLTRADLRRRTQEFDKNITNLFPPERRPNSTQDYNQYFDESLERVKSEADGKERLDQTVAEQILSQRQELSERADLLVDSAPGFAQLSYATLAKAGQFVGEDYADFLRLAKDIKETRDSELIVKPDDLLPDAVVMGIVQREAADLELPPLKALAENALADQELLTATALVLNESERAEFLDCLPEESRERTGKFMDIEASHLLHQSLVGKKTEKEYQQRLMVLNRLFHEFEGAVKGKTKNTPLEVALIGEAIGEMGDDVRPRLLDLMRDELEDRATNRSAEQKKDYIPRIMKIMVDNFDDFRANDLILRFAGDSEVPDRMSEYLLKKLVERGYLPRDSEEWYRAEKGRSKKTEEEIKPLEVVKSVISDLSVMPTAEILEFIANKNNWSAGGRILDLSERIAQIKSSQEQFEKLTDSGDLIGALNADENKAMIYYLLNGGRDRFNLINNYDFGKFKEMLGLIADLRVHERPLIQFKEALINSGLSGQEADKIIKRLRGGHYPLEQESQSRQDVSFEVSENAVIKNANRELGQIMGREQLGVMLMFPFYRELAVARGVEEKIFAQAQTFSERLAVIENLDKQFPDLQEQAQAELAPAWQKFGEKMMMELTLDTVLNEASVPVHGEEILPKLDSKRIDLRRIKKDLLVLLKSENKQLRDIGNNVRAKKKARQQLALGLEKQTEEKKRSALEEKIAAIDSDLRELEQRRLALSEVRVDERFSHLSPAEKKAEIEKLSQEIAALTEKSPSAIFVYLVMQTVGEDRLRESDVGLLREMESHLQGPFQMVADSKLYDRGRREQNKRSNITLNWLDKSKRLMNMVRFADSRICCFSTGTDTYHRPNEFAFNQSNKTWVASINKDPLSFVISMEEDNNELVASREQARENLGFIFGSFGIDDEGKLAVMLNGFYYAPGFGNSQAAVIAVEEKIEAMLRGLPVNTLVIASRYGGLEVGKLLPNDFSNNEIKLTRLRALDDGGGNPETMIYDDLNTGQDLNRPHYYDSNVWHKKIAGQG